MEIALEESRRMGLTLPGLDLAHRMYRELAQGGSARKGTQVCVHACVRVLFWCVPNGCGLILGEGVRARVCT